MTIGAVLFGALPARADVALICGSPYAVAATFGAPPSSFRLPSGDVVSGADLNWPGTQGCRLVAVAPFIPPPGQQITGAPSYSIDGGGNVSMSYATAPIPPAPIASMQLASSSTPSLNGIYPIDPAVQQKVQAISLYIAVNGKFPAGQSAQAWPDLSGTLHFFPTTTLWQAFATAMADFVAAVDLGQPPAQPVNIP